MLSHLMIYGLSLFFLGTTIIGACWAEDFKIAIDIGHTRNSPGATSARGVPEYFFNKNIGTLLRTKLIQNKKFKGSFIINETGDDIPLSDRAVIANQRKANLLVSIHHDSVEPKDLSQWVYKGIILPHCDKFTGYSIFYSEKNGSPADSLQFAEVLGSEMLHAGFCPTLHHAERFIGGDKDLVDKTRGIYKYNNLIILKNSNIPAVLFECGIIKNRNEEIVLCNAEYQRKLVVTLYNAIKKYFESSKNKQKFL